VRKKAILKQIEKNLKWQPHLTGFFQNLWISISKGKERRPLKIEIIFLSEIKKLKWNSKKFSPSWSHLKARIFHSTSFEYWINALAKLKRRDLRANQLRSILRLKTTQTKLFLLCSHYISSFFWGLFDTCTKHWTKITEWTSIHHLSFWWKTWELAIYSSSLTLCL